MSANDERPSRSAVAPETALQPVDTASRNDGIRTVLIVDDDSALREAVVRYLGGKGYAVVEAPSLAEGVAKAPDAAIDLAFVDLDLPDGEGFEVVRACKDAIPARPVLVLTGVREREARVRAFDAGADDVVEKPIWMPELSRRMEVQDRILRTTAALQKALHDVDLERVFAAEAAALLAHDLYNGLFVAGANLSFVHEAVGVATDSEAREALDASQRALRRMTTLVKNFVDIARSEDRELKPQRQCVSPSAIIRLAASTHHLRGSTSERAIEVDCDETIRVWIDPILFERILHNLLINATRYVDQNGRVFVGARLAEDETLVVRVANTGPVIPPSLRDNLFEKYRTGGDRKAQVGMGLYFCRLACEAHDGGSIALIDGEGFSTTFEFRLPGRQAENLDAMRVVQPE